MAFRARSGADARGRSVAARSPPPPIITTHHSSVSSTTRSSASSIASSTASNSTLSPHHLSIPRNSPNPPSPLSSSPLPTLHSGLLKKKSPSGFSYHTRFFTLSTRFLSYFSKPSDHFPLGYLALSEILTISSSATSIELGLQPTAGGGEKERKYRLLAESREECEGWRRYLEAAVMAVKREETERRVAPVDEDLSPRTPMALKRSGVLDSEWKEEPSELERAFFALKFSGRRGSSLCRLLMDVRSDLDILRFLLELLLDAPEMRQGPVLSIVPLLTHERRQLVTSVYPIPVSLTAALSTSSTSSFTTPKATVPSTTSHARALSAGPGKELEEFKDGATTTKGKSVSDPTSPLVSPRLSVSGEAASKAVRAMSVISVSTFTEKVKAMKEKLASYARVVSLLSFEDKQFVLAWLFSPSALSCLTSLLLVPNGVLHDRVLRVLFLHCVVVEKRERKLHLLPGVAAYDSLVDHVGDRFAALMRRQHNKVTLPSFQLQLFQSLLLILTTPLALFPQPVFPSSITFTHAAVHHPSLLRTVLASLFHTDFHLRKKVLKDFHFIMSQPGHRAILAAEKEVTRWLLLGVCDVPLKQRKKNGVGRKVLDYAMKTLTTLHTLAFAGREHRPAEEHKTTMDADDRPQPASGAAGSLPSLPLPLFPELIARALLLASASSPRHSHSIARSILLYLITDLFQQPQVFYASPHPSSSHPLPNPAPASGIQHMDSLCYHNLLHLLTLVKTFIFLPDRFADMVGRAESAIPDLSDEGRSRRSTSLARLPITTSSTCSIIDLIPSSALASTLQHNSASDPLLLDLSTLLNLPLAPLTTEDPSSAAATFSSPIAASIDSDLSSLLSAPVGRFDVHRLERRGLKADAELLAQVTRLLSVLSSTVWHHLPSFAVKGGIRVGERVASELSFFQDANVFLLLLAPMVSTSGPSSSPSSSSTAAASSGLTSSLLTPAETSEVVEQFLFAKPSGRRKVFRHYEQSYRSREQAESRAAETRSKEIEQQMQVDAEKERQVRKILLLGPAEAGKSTLFKQMKKVYGEGFSTVDRQAHVVLILANLLRAMRALIFHSDRLLLRFPFSALSNLTGSSTTTIDPSLDASKQFITQIDLVQHFPSLQLNSAEKIAPQTLPPTLLSALTGDTFASLFALCMHHLSALWLDLGVQLTYENRAKFDVHQLYDGDGFFLARLDELQVRGWLPCEEDVIRTRVRSLGVSQYAWEDSAGQRYRMTDVAGQRSERKKWMGFFNDADCVLFVAAVSEYDQVLSEEPTVNRLHESLQAFQQLTTVPFFDPIPLVLLLNKADLYRDKMQRTSLKVCFPKLRFKDEGREVEEGLVFIQTEFLRRVRGGGEGERERPVFVHVISAVQPEAARTCLKQINSIVRERMWQHAHAAAQMQ